MEDPCHVLVSARAHVYSCVRVLTLCLCMCARNRFFVGVWVCVCVCARARDWEWKELTAKPIRGHVRVPRILDEQTRSDCLSGVVTLERTNAMRGYRTIRLEPPTKGTSLLVRGGGNHGESWN